MPDYVAEGQVTYIGFVEFGALWMAKNHCENKCMGIPFKCRNEYYNDVKSLRNKMEMLGFFWKVFMKYCLCFQFLFFFKETCSI